MKAQSLLAGLALAVACSSAVEAASRFVVVNGQRMSPAQVRQLDQMSCARVPDGRYWIDIRTGAWGYEGGPPQGRVGDACQRRRPSLSERGLLYSPGELLR